jgi:hypothetical protein
VGTPAGSVKDPFDPDGVRFLIDHNLAPGFARAFTHVGFNSQSNADVGLADADDPAVIEFCGRTHAVWVTQDMDARKRASYKPLVGKHDVSAVFFRLPKAKGMTMKDRFAVLARWMPWLEDRYEAQWPRYFLLGSRGEPRELRHFAEKSARRR